MKGYHKIMENATNFEEEIQALVSIMYELTIKRLDLENDLKLLKQEIEKYEFRMQEILKEQNKEIITCGYWSFGWKTGRRTVFDQKKFKEEYPNLYEEFKTTNETKRFCFGHKE